MLVFNSQRPGGRSGAVVKSEELGDEWNGACRLLTTVLGVILSAVSRRGVLRASAETLSEEVAVATDESNGAPLSTGQYLGSS
jgi:hypothetical protein